jgi:membrane-bound lytic murein transglycosylase B
LSPALDAVPVSSPAYDQAQRSYASDWQRLLDAQRRAAQAQAQLATLEQTEARLVGDRNGAQRRHDKSEARVVSLRSSLQSLVVAEYMNGRGAPEGSELDPAQATQIQTSQVMVDSIGRTRLADLTVNQSIVDQTGQQISSDDASLADVHARQSVASGQLATAQSDESSTNAALGRDRQAIADTRLTARVTGLDLTLVVLDAYWRASALLAVRQPACRISWPVLAGIGKVESGQGTFRGDSVTASGEEARPIIGIALDGTNHTQVVGDTDGGALDGDPVHDRAVGPMQVLPSAWRRYGLDGNGDGRVDPQNMYDAAATAAVMLCRYGALDTDAGLDQTFFHYNPSNAYVAEVLGFTHGYAGFAIPPVA